MADILGTEQEEAARLEAALERISRAGAHRPTSVTQAAPPLAGRLDALIAEIRAALGKDGADQATMDPTLRPR